MKLVFLRTGRHRLRPENPYTSMAVPPAPFRVPNQRPLARVSRQSHPLVNDKDDNERYQGLCTEEVVVVVIAIMNTPI